MNSKPAQAVMEAYSEISAIVASLKLADAKDSRHGVSRGTVVRSRGVAVMNPAGFWASALVGETGDVQTVENGIKLAAAKLRAGDISFVIESSLGQIAWLSALTLELAEDASSPGLPKRVRVQCVTLALRAQGAAARLGLSLGALVKFDGGGSVVLEGGDE